MKEPSSPKRMAILIVEDDPHSQLYFNKLLSGIYDTAVAATAREAWELLHSRTFNLVLMDISLKGDEDGLSLTRRLREEESFKKLPIVTKKLSSKSIWMVGNFASESSIKKRCRSSKSSLKTAGLIMKKNTSPA